MACKSLLVPTIHFLKLGFKKNYVKYSANNMYNVQYFLQNPECVKYISLILKVFMRKQKDIYLHM